MLLGLLLWVGGVQLSVSEFWLTSWTKDWEGRSHQSPSVTMGNTQTAVVCPRYGLHWVNDCQSLWLALSLDFTPFTLFIPLSLSFIHSPRLCLPFRSLSSYLFSWPLLSTTLAWSFFLISSSVCVEFLFPFFRCHYVSVVNSTADSRNRCGTLLRW